MTTDTEFLRRVSIDLTGRIPTPDQVNSFTQSTDPSKRSSLIDQLMATDSFADNWTLFFSNMFQVTSGYYNFISIPGRDQFQAYLREFIQNDRSYRDVAREMIAFFGASPVVALALGIRLGATPRGRIHPNIHPSALFRKEDISTLLGIGHFYFALTCRKKSAFPVTITLPPSATCRRARRGCCFRLSARFASWGLPARYFRGRTK